MVATPHMFNGLSGNPRPEEILERVQALNAALGDISLKILPGNEVHVSHETAEHARSNRVMKLNNKKYMLVEFPQLSVPIGADELFDRLQVQGTYPILVHPERNSQIQARPSIVAGFIERGVLIQVTAMSVTGEFGSAAKNCADILLRHNCVHVLATDTHRPSRRPPILSKGRDAAAAIIGVKVADKLVNSNPLAIVSGQILRADPTISFAKKKSTFFSRFFK
jgi:protein-tyrosine phosphatase